jgi:hypothetical protein
MEKNCIHLYTKVYTFVYRYTKGEKAMQLYEQRIQERHMWMYTDGQKAYVNKNKNRTEVVQGTVTRTQTEHMQSSIKKPKI